MIYEELYKILGEQGIVKTEVSLEEPDFGERRICSGDDLEETGVFCTDGKKVFREVFRQNPRLVILGGGHVSRPVAKIGKMLGFYVTVMDDREEFLTEERFPDADERILGTFEELSKRIPAYENTYYVVVTRGHAGDTLCARQILRRPYVYFGMIGSRNKVRITREKLYDEGYTTEELDSIHAPIGLPIGGQLPEEIAVSIMAEIVQVKNKSYSAFVDESIASAVLRGEHGVMMTIIRKSGSSPRGTGSKMFLSSQGHQYGSIGGGSVEYEAVLHAADVRRAECVTYQLSAGDERNLGMICGGTVEVLFEIV